MAGMPGHRMATIPRLTMCMKGLACVMLVLLSICMPAVAAVHALTVPEARYAAAASIQLIPQNDIESGHHAHILRIADLDEDRIPEIVYLLTAFNTGSNFDATNNLVVMTRLEADDERGVGPYPGSSTVTDADYAEIRNSGYANDASTHIPGEVGRLLMRSDARIEVWFLSREDSPICKRYVETSKGREATSHCPPPGWHHWVYAWTPGQLQRVECLNGSMEKIRCSPGDDGGQTGTKKD